MESHDGAQQWAYATQPVSVTTGQVADLPKPSTMLLALLWAVSASTLHRVRHGEGALLAVNLSLIALYYHGSPWLSLAQALVSVLAIGLMYAFNDLYDAPTDCNNPKKDPVLVSTYLAHRRACGVGIFALTVLTLALALPTLGARVALALGAVLLVNVVYSTVLKSIPIVDVVWCGVWGALYAAIVTASLQLLVLVGLMTAVCHLYQTLDDRAADAANGITTTAVRSLVLSRAVLLALSALLYLVLRPALGGAWALTAFIPLALFFVADYPRTGWLLTKVYFGVVWLYLLGIARATG